MLHDCDRRVDGELRRALADKELSLLIAEVAAKRPARRRRSSTAATPAAAPATRSSGHGAGCPDVDNVEAACAGPRRGARHAAARRRSSCPARSASWTRATATARRARRLPLVRDGQGAPGRRGHAWRVLRRPRRRRSTRSGTRTTYRSLLTTVRARVERTAAGPAPGAVPARSRRARRRAVPRRRRRAGRRVVHGQPRRRRLGGRRRLVHGLRDPVGDEAFVLACTAPDGDAGGRGARHGRRGRALERRAGRVGAGRRGLRAPSSPTCRCRRPRSSSIRGSLRAGDRRRHRRRRRRRARRGRARRSPRPGPAARRRRTSGSSTPSTALGRAPAPAGRRPGAGHRRRSRRADGSPVASRLSGVGVADGAGAASSSARLEHVARWEQVRALGDHPSPLADAVTLDVYAADGGRDAADRPTASRCRPTAATSSRTAAAPDGSWQPPRVFMELRNQPTTTSTSPCSTSPTASAATPSCRPSSLGRRPLVRPVVDGAPIPASLPAGRPVAPGASARDWLKVVVSDVDFDATVASTCDRARRAASAPRAPVGSPAGSPRIDARRGTRRAGPHQPRRWRPRRRRRAGAAPSALAPRSAHERDRPIEHAASATLDHCQCSQ